MSKYISPTAARVTLGALAAYEGTMAFDRFEDRKYTFMRAQERARLLGKSLIVVGDPDGGMHTRLLRAYGCGDITIDLSGAPTCPNGIRADITKRIPLPDNNGVVFVSCVFEYVDDPIAAYRECLRVAGDKRNLFVTRVSPYTLTAHFYPGAKWTIDYDANGNIVFQPMTTLHKTLAAASMAVLGYAAWKGI